jgi:hypothetical protein
MIIILGLIILVAALVVGVAGVLGNAGSAHPLTHFSVLGYHVTGSAGTLFLAGIVVGAAGLLGLSLVLAGARRTSRRGSAARRGLRQSRRETAAASQERDDLIEQRDTARADAASNLTNGAAIQDAPPRPAGDRWGRLRDIRHRLAPPQADAVSESPAPSAPASSSEADVAAGSDASDMPADPSDPGVTPLSQVFDAHATAPASAD